MSESPLINYTLFINEDGIPMDFVIDHKDKETAKKWCREIRQHLGTATCDVKQFGPYTAVMVQDDRLTWRHTHDFVFKISYINACLEEGVVLNITRFLKFRLKNFSTDFDYMKIVYSQKLSWTSALNKFSLPLTLSDTDDSYNDSDIAEVHPNHSKEDALSFGKTKFASSRQGSVVKKTRRSYTEEERVKILKYIVGCSGYNNIKGTVLWKEMESDDVCPRRTWQSMKEHFLKVISRNLRHYEFLMENELEKFRKVLKNRNNVDR